MIVPVFSLSAIEISVVCLGLFYNRSTVKKKRNFKKYIYIFNIYIYYRLITVYSPQGRHDWKQPIIVTLLDCCVKLHLHVSD